MYVDALPVLLSVALPADSRDLIFPQCWYVNACGNLVELDLRKPSERTLINLLFDANKDRLDQSYIVLDYQVVFDPSRNRCLSLYNSANRELLCRWEVDPNGVSRAGVLPLPGTLRQRVSQIFLFDSHFAAFRPEGTNGGFEIDLFPL